MASDEVAFSKVSELAALLKAPGIQDGRIAAVLNGIAEGRSFDEFVRLDLVHTLDWFIMLYDWETVDQERYDGQVEAVIDRLSNYLDVWNME